MKYEISFTGTKAEKEKQALRATRDYLGLARYLQVRRKLVDYCLDVVKAEGGGCATMYRRIQFALMLLGVQGRYPIRAVVRDVLHSVNAVLVGRNQRAPG